MTAEVCKLLRKLTSVKTEWAWNGKHQELYDKVKNIIKQDRCMKFYDASRPLYLGTDASGISLEAGHLQVRDGMKFGQGGVLNNTALHSIDFACKGLSSMEQQYSNTE